MTRACPATCYCASVKFGRKVSFGRIELREEVLGVMRQLAEEGMTMIVVTHEVQFARDMADRVVFFEGGRVAESGTPGQILSAAQQERTREFLRRAATY